MKRLQCMVCVVCVAAASLALTGVAEAIVYVDVDRAGGDGTSWANAYNSLQTAIGARGTSEEFWVAEGTYQPSAMLQPKAGSKIYGGFNGTETARSQRNVSANPAILDGRNTLKHVLFIPYSSTSVRLDGLTFTRGAASSGSGWDEFGGGVFVNDVQATIVNCTFDSNSATVNGGGLFIYHAPGTVRDCTFVNNTSPIGGGFASHTATVTLDGCTFMGNQALTGAKTGGAANFVYGSVTVTDCIFLANEAQEGGALQGNQTTVYVSGSTFSSNVTSLAGGGIHLNQGSGTVVDSTFVGNQTQNGTFGFGVGAGIYSYYSPITISGCTFIGNSCSHAGAAVCYDYDIGTAEQVSDSIFTDNDAGFGGGALASFARDIDLTSCVFNRNSSANGGALWFNKEGGNLTPEISNCTFFGNTATTYGGAICNSSITAFQLNNCILWGNSCSQGQDIHSTGTSALTTRYCDIESSSYGSPVSGSHTAKFSSNPLFEDTNGDDNIAGNLDDDFQLQSGSPCIDRAHGGYAPSTDIIGIARYDIPSTANLGTGSPNYADVGAYESVQPVETPAFSPAPGTFNNLISLSISCATPGATIYYTIDGTTPNQSSTQGASLTILTNTTVKARAYYTGMPESSVTTGVYVVQDSDSDGLPDWMETDTGTYVSPTNTGSDPGVADSDNDNLDDWDEVHIYGTDPNVADSDSDGLDDDDEILTHGTDPNDSDSDDDGYLDGWEVGNGYDPLGGDGEVQGTTSYTGALSGPVVLDVFSASDFSGSPVSTAEETLGVYSVTGLLSGTYYVRCNILAGASPQVGRIRRQDPWGTYGPYTNPTPVVVTSSLHVVTGIDMSLVDATPEAPNPFANVRARLDFDGDGKSDLGLYDAAGNDGKAPGSWSLLQSSNGETNQTFGYVGTTALVGDFDGDGKSGYGCYDAAGIPGVVDPGSWYLMQSSDGFTTKRFGYQGTVAFTGDFDGDGKDDYGCYDAAGIPGLVNPGTWYLMQSTAGFTTKTFGYAGTVPLVGDFDGDGKDDYGCYDAAGIPGLVNPGAWYLMQSSDGFTTKTFGYAGTVPLVGDFDGDGKDDYGCYDAAGIPGLAPAGSWYLMQSSAGFTTKTFGYAGTVAVVGDFDGDGKDDYGCYDAAGIAGVVTPGTWFLMKSADGFSTQVFGYAGSVPLQ